jgi:prepilin-type N-terminal cleavage/methylation domain-containing protein
MTARLRQREGFTLVEVLVTIAMMLVVFGAVLTVFDTFQSDTRYGQLRNEAQDNARNAMDRLARELRNVAAPESEAGGALEIAEPYSIVFQTIDASKTSSGSNAKNVMRVRYCLDDSEPTKEILWRQYKRWTSAATPAAPTETKCPDNSGYWDGKQSLARRIVNRIGGKPRAVFVYGPPGATLVTQITTVSPTLYLDLSPGSRPGETQLTSAISLRNENRKPTASFSAKEIGTRKVLLNASESTDPDGLALTYKWKDNGKLLESTAQQVETGTLVSKSTHEFELEVEDPGKLTDKAKRTVVIK